MVLKWMREARRESKEVVKVKSEVKTLVKGDEVKVEATWVVWGEDESDCREEKTEEMEDVAEERAGVILNLKGTTQSWVLVDLVYSRVDGRWGGRREEKGYQGPPKWSKGSRAILWAPKLRSVDTWFRSPPSNFNSKKRLRCACLGYWRGDSFHCVLLRSLNGLGKATTIPHSHHTPGYEQA